MFTIALLVLLSLVLAATALRWGTDSRDCIDSKEWERRRERVWPTIY